MSRVNFIKKIGKFDGITPVAKYAARLGQQFSSSVSIKLPKGVRVIREDDIGQFTDGIPLIYIYIYLLGIGMISDDLIKIIRKSLAIPQISAV